MEVISGKIEKPKKVVLYGPEGIGKSSLAAQFPNPIFIDTEGSTTELNVDRLPKPTSWTMLNQQIEWVKQQGERFGTLIIDTVDWAEMQCTEFVCAQHGKKGVEDFGYGNGYVYVKEELGRFLNKLSDVIDAGINVVLTAHSQIVKFEQPDEMGSYDRYQLKLGKKTSSQTA
ncbi:TPA: ATP-binding protein, partial [Escherichia coli]